MRPGKLDQLIAIQSYAETANGGGGVTKTWSDLATDPNVWAHVNASSGSESFEDDRTNATANIEFTIRNRVDVNETMRIVWESKNYNIRHVSNESSRALYLKITAEGGVSN